jgi:hypothetical protein
MYTLLEPLYFGVSSIKHEHSLTIDQLYTLWSRTYKDGAVCEDDFHEIDHEDHGDEEVIFLLNLNICITELYLRLWQYFWPIGTQLWWL